MSEKVIKVQQIKVPIRHTIEDVKKKAAKLCRIQPADIKECEIRKRSIDARRKNEIYYIYTVYLKLSDNKKKCIDKIMRDKHVSIEVVDRYNFMSTGREKLKKRPIIIGAGPAGLFCAYELAKAGYAPLVLERGKAMEERLKDVDAFWQTGVLNTASNVQFGEGGAGTFSDGKLNTLVKDVKGRNRHVLETFVQFGAKSNILYDNKPHIGTDILRDVIVNMRKEIEYFGGEIRFSQEVTDVIIENHQIQAIEVNSSTRIATDIVVLAIGHSARNTFEMLYRRQIPMEAKAFAVGFRIEHPQEMMNLWQYKGADMTYLPPASYKLTANMPDKTGIYSFCMCPGGYVVNASSEEQRLAVNGMSYQSRAGANANSAIIVTVHPQDYADYTDSPLAGVVYQRKLEEKAYQMGNGCIPQQLFGDYLEKKNTTGYGTFASETKGATAFAPLHELFSDKMRMAFLYGMEQFGNKIQGFDRYDAILSGVESRTSSPIRIHRKEDFMSDIVGIYPCGEGAGYAGGIMSAAMDGIKVAEAIAAVYSAT